MNFAAIKFIKYDFKYKFARTVQNYVKIKTNSLMTNQFVQYL